MRLKEILNFSLRCASYVKERLKRPFCAALLRLPFNRFYWNGCGSKLRSQDAKVVEWLVYRGVIWNREKRFYNYFGCIFGYILYNNRCSMRKLFAPVVIKLNRMFKGKIERGKNIGLVLG